MKYTENNLPETVVPRINHYHAGNSSKRVRHGKEYLTTCRLIDKHTGELVAFGEAYCTDRDAPRRSVGRHIAVGRAFKQLVTQ